MSNMLTENQSLATTLLNCPLSVRASAGSGKTSTLVERYINLLRAGFTPKEILTVTFTREAANQLRDRIIARLLEAGFQTDLIAAVEDTRSIGTIHSLCYTILNQFGEELGLAPVKEITDEFAFSGAFSSSYQQWVETQSHPDLSALLQHFSHRELNDMARAIYRNRYLFYESLSLAQDSGGKDPGGALLLLLGRTLKPLMAQLTSRFHAHGSYTFDDLEHLALRVLSESTLARTRLTQQYRHILLDEFQDTSSLQWQILRILLGEFPEKLFIVGDPKQSIYGFRQAEPALFEEVTQLICHKGGRELALIHNFRSEPGLLDTINFLSEHLFENQSFSWVPMLSGTAVTNKSIAPFRLHWYGPNTKTTRRELQQSEIPAVVTEIESLLKRGIAPGSIAILSRNTDRITEFAQALKEKGIPVRCKQTEALTHQLDVLDVISFLQCVAAPLDDTKLIGFLRSSFIQFSYQQILNLTLQRTVTNKTYEPLIHVLLRTPPQELTWFVDLLNSGESLVERCLLALFTHANYFPQNQEAFNAILKPLSQPHLQLFEIQADLQAWRDSELLFNRDSDFQESPTSVQLMTVHASKGLEFDFVFLVDGLRQLPQDLPPVLVKPGLPPGIRFWQNNEKIMSASYQGLLDELRKKNEEEARRILYVAITRARKELHFFAPHLDSGAYPAHSWAQLLVDACLNWENGRTQNKPRELPGSTTPSVSGCTT